MLPRYGMPMSNPTAHFSDVLAAAIDRTNSVACIGLDPVIEKIPAAVTSHHQDPVEAISEFCKGVLEAVAPHVGVVKPQSACFERYGQAGVAVLRRVVQAAHERGLVVILDAKRGDIGVTAEHYARAAFGGAQGSPAHGADSITLNGYMGPDTIEPFLTDVRRGVFVLVRTSNPGSDAVQAQKLADGRTVAEMVADMVATLGAARKGACGLSDVGAVVGATKSAEAAALRKRMPDAVFLIPGYGAQGGTIEDIRPALREARTKSSAASMGVLVNASRSVLYPKGGMDASDWRRPIEDAAKQLVGELRGL